MFSRKGTEETDVIIWADSWFLLFPFLWSSQVVESLTLYYRSTWSMCQNVISVSRKCIDLSLKTHHFCYQESSSISHLVFFRISLTPKYHHSRKCLFWSLCQTCADVLLCCLKMVTLNMLSLHISSWNSLLVGFAERNWFKSQCFLKKTTTLIHFEK